MNGSREKEKDGQSNLSSNQTTSTFELKRRFLKSKLRITNNYVNNIYLDLYLLFNETIKK